MKTTRKRRQFKPKRKLSRGLVIKSVENWIPTSAKDNRVARMVGQLSQTEFEKKLIQILHYHVITLYYHVIDEALTKRIELYLGLLKSDILRIANHSISSRQSKKLDSILREYFYEIEKSASGMWSDPNIVLPDKTQYRNAFEAIIEISKMNAYASRRLREEIAYQFYIGVEKIKWLCKMKGRGEYDCFIGQHILSNRDLSNFLRGGKVQNQTMDISSFERSRIRFMKRYQQK